MTRLLATFDPGRLTVLSLDLVTENAPPIDPASRLVYDMARKNIKTQATLIAAAGAAHQPLKRPKVSNPNSAGAQFSKAVAGSSAVQSADLVLVDVSALPLGVHFAIISGLLEMVKRRDLRAELQVVACHNPKLDAAIVHEGVTLGSPIRGFMHALRSPPHGDRVIVWAPVLGPGRSAALKAIFDELEPMEICPVLPFPASSARRADDIILEYRELLFGQFGVEAGNIIYADERNPFDLYRQLSRLNRRYHRAVAPIGEAVVALSSHSSKLLSLGVLLASHEHALPVLAAPSSGYRLADGVSVDALAAHNSLSCLWLAGRPYA